MICNRDLSIGLYLSSSHPTTMSTNPPFAAHKSPSGLTPLFTCNVDSIAGGESSVSHEVA